jgi:hypothetical protein
VCSYTPTPTVTTTAITTTPPTTTTSTSTTSTTSTTTSTAPTCATTPNEVLQNGGFECGIYPWRALVAHGTTYTLTSPGSSSSSFAFEVDQNDPLDSIGLGETIIQQLFYVTPRTQYTLAFNPWWNAGNGGFIGVKFNEQPQYTVDASDKAGPGVWDSNSISSTATTAQYLLEFEFLFGTNIAAAKIDNVVLSPGT